MFILQTVSVVHFGATTDEGSKGDIMKTIITLLATTTLICSASVASAQDYTLEPGFGSVSLESGFQPDPYEVNLISGGMTDASSVGCVGMIAEAPDFRLDYAASDILPLILSVGSASDTTLVVNMPDGSWACDDDSAGDFNPMLEFNQPMSGQYDIWVGAFGGGNEEATLYISEVIAGPSFGGGMPDFSLTPTFGTVDLETGFEPDPYNVELTSGGNIDAEVVGCAGMIATAPDFRLNYVAGDVFPLIISTMSSDDTTLVINQPDGSWICDDDSGEDFNASVNIASPMTGQYDIWVGSFFGDSQPATLSISELASN